MQCDARAVGIGPHAQRVECSPGATGWAAEVVVELGVVVDQAFGSGAQGDLGVPRYEREQPRGTAPYVDFERYGDRGRSAKRIDVPQQQGFRSFGDIGGHADSPLFTGRVIARAIRVRAAMKRARIKLTGVHDRLPNDEKQQTSQQTIARMAISTTSPSFGLYDSRPSRVDRGSQTA